jgi:hypothetical protein
MTFSDRENGWFMASTAGLCGLSGALVPGKSGFGGDVSTAVKRDENVPQ